MDHYKIMLIAAILFVVQVLLRYFILDSIRGKLKETKGLKVHTILSVVVIIIGITTLIFMIVKGYDSYFKWFWFSFIGTLFATQALIEWIYVRKEKEYVISIITMIVGMLLVYFWY
ncbi:DUF4181 domain-containing protein [Bacillaceae bacterium W0354]